MTIISRFGFLDIIYSKKNLPIKESHLLSSDKVAAVDPVASDIFSFIADVVISSTDDNSEVVLINRVVDEAVVVDVSIDVVSAEWLLPHTTLRFPPKPPESMNKM